jgi:hypothetical protein
MSEKSAVAAGGYDAVIYVHGMGSQRRYEETSRLIDSLDRYAENRGAEGQPVGLVRGIEVEIEPFQPDRTDAAPKDIVSYIKARYLPPKAGGAYRDVRFYEAYWAPVMAGQKSPWSVLRWMALQIRRPFLTLSSPWRERQRLRRSALVALFDRGRKRPPGAEEGEYSNLLALYADFESLPAQRAYPKGRFGDFLAFIRSRAADPETAERQLRLARIWRAAYRHEELRNAFLLLTMGLAMVVSALLVVLGALQVTGLFMADGAPQPKDFLALLRASLPLALGILGALVPLLMGGFLTDYMGDVEAWATYEETNEKHVARNKVLNEGIALLSHVLGDPACRRLTIVSHSLGTSVAHDTLLALTRRNRARNARDPLSGPVPLEKIRHFVTLASPIDKIEYFFESYASGSHRYKRVVEELRGDIGSAPFTRRKTPHIHWLNFWDEGDLISGALHSPASAAEFCQRVDNIRVDSFGFPRALASHSGYFNNRTVISHLFEIIFQGRRSFEPLKASARRAGAYEAIYVGPGGPAGRAPAFLMVATALPWLGATTVLAAALNSPAASGLGWVTAAGAGVLAAGWTLSALRGQRTPV